MNREDAFEVLQRVFAPLPVDGFLDDTLDQRFIRVSGDGNEYRADLLGGEPERLLLEAFGEISPHLGYHAAEPLGPPPPVEPVAGVFAFKTKIAAFHSLGYTVRLPQPRWLSPRLGELLRALEFLFHKPATAEVFWSRRDAKAPVHHDDYDIIVIQLRGRKRWFISSGPSELHNAWETIPLGPPTLGPFETVEVGPGDLLYLPRGTKHRVDALEDSIHLSIGFVPLTLREAMIAVLDHLSERDRTLREAVGSRLSSAVTANNFDDLAPRIREGVARLAAFCQSDEAIALAMQRRSSRAIRDLKSPAAAERSDGLSANSQVRHSPLAICHLTVTSDKIDFSYPGGHIYIHPGVERSVRFICDTPRFRVRDVPGDVGDDIRIALVDKFLSSGFLELVRD
jgi:hypothetical protein